LARQALRNRVLAALAPPIFAPLSPAAPPCPFLPPQDAADDGAAPKGNEFKHVRRQLAQVMTVLREKQIADGIGRKDARRLEKAASVGAGMGGK
jgi:hypothetical protein